MVLPRIGTKGIGWEGKSLEEATERDEIFATETYLPNTKDSRDNPDGRANEPSCRTEDSVKENPAPSLRT